MSGPITYGEARSALRADGVIHVDAACPCCGWPERTYDIETRRFGCHVCTYTSDERNA